MPLGDHSKSTISISAKSGCPHYFKELTVLTHHSLVEQVAFLETYGTSTFFFESTQEIRTFDDKKLTLIWRLQKLELGLPITSNVNMVKSGTRYFQNPAVNLKDKLQFFYDGSNHQPSKMKRFSIKNASLGEWSNSSQIVMPTKEQLDWEGFGIFKIIRIAFPKHVNNLTEFSQRSFVP